IFKALLPLKVSTLPLGTEKSVPVDPEIVSRFPSAPALRVTPLTLLISRSAVIVWVATLVTVGEGVEVPSKYKMSPVAGVARVGFQLVPTVQSVAAPAVPPIQVQVPDV